jgi:hypothetical protein
LLEKWQLKVSKYCWLELSVDDVVDDATLQNFMLLLLCLFTELVSFAVEKERFAQLLHNFVMC